MASNETKKRVIIDLQVTSNQAVDQIVRLSEKIDELKVSKSTLEKLLKDDRGNKDYKMQLAEVNAEIANANASMKGYQKELQNIKKAQDADANSLEAMRAQLAVMVKQYDALNEVQRESTDGTRLQENIKSLTEEIKELEGETGRMQRNVGNYKESFEQAINETVPLKKQLKELKQEITNLTYEYDNFGDKLDEQRAKMAQVEAQYGKGSKEYQAEAQTMQQLEKQYDDTGKALTDMTQKAGLMYDAMDKANQSVKNSGDGEAAIHAMTAAGGLLADSYTLVQTAMAGLGLQSEALINVFAKVELVEKSINSINKISAALQEESILRVTLHNAVAKIRNVYAEQYNAQLAKQAVAQTEANIATTEATVATGALATGEKVATGASFSLTAALKTVGVAIKSIPVIGWILAAVAALGTLIGLIVKSSKAEKENNAILNEKRDITAEIGKVRQEALEGLTQEQTKLQLHVDLLKATEKGTKGYDDAVKQVASDLGVTEKWLKKNITKVDELAVAWMEVKKMEVLADAYARQYAEERIANEKKLMALKKAMATNDLEGNKTNLTEAGFSEQQADVIAANIHKKFSNANAAIREGVEWLDDYQRKLETDSNQALKNIEQQEKKAITAQVNLTKKYNEATKGGTETKKTTTSSNISEQKKKELEEQRKVEDLLLANVKQSNEKQIAEYKAKQERIVEDLRKRLSTENNLTDGAKKAIEQQITIIEANAITEVDRMRKSYNEERIREEYEVEKRIAENRLKLLDENSEEAIEIRKEQIKKEYDEQIEAIQKANEEYRKQIKANADVLNDETTLNTYATRNNIDVEAARNELNEQNEQLFNLTQKNEEDILQLKQNYQAEATAMVRTATENREQIVKDIEAKRLELRMKEELQAVEGNEVEKAQIKLKYAQNQYDNDKADYDNLVGMEDNWSDKFDSYSEYTNAVLEANGKMIDSYAAMKDASNEFLQSQTSQTLKSISNFATIGQSVAGMVGTMNDLFNTMAESNEKYSSFAKALAISQIYISAAISTAQAVQAAVQAGGFTGVAAPVTIPLFIAEIVGIVASTIASTMKTINQVKQPSRPSFATGGLVTGAGTGTSDSITANLSNGESVMTARATASYAPLLSAINVAGGGVPITTASSNNTLQDMFTEAFASMPSPVVSVKEITNTQSRVRIKENISRG